MLQAPQNSILTGASYFIEGIRLLWHRQLRAYILVPLLVNVVLFAVLTSVLISYLGMFTNGFDIEVADWLRPVVDFLLKLLGVVLLILEIKVASYGLLTIGGLTALVIRESFEWYADDWKREIRTLAPEQLFNPLASEVARSLLLELERGVPERAPLRVLRYTSPTHEEYHIDHHGHVSL